MRYGCRCLDYFSSERFLPAGAEKWSAGQVNFLRLLRISL
jgi:hypothetical protein